MSLQQKIEKALVEWSRISHLDFALLESSGAPVCNPSSRELPNSSILTAFLDSGSRELSLDTLQLYKVDEDTSYVLAVWGEDRSHTIGRLAVCQVASLMDALRARSDKNTFMQNLLLGAYNQVDLYNQAKKMRIPAHVRRGIFMVETKQARDENALATIKNIFSAKTGNFITAIDDQNIIIVKELQKTDTVETLDTTAHMLIDMINTEAMTQAWVSYGNIAEELTGLPAAYQEAKTALEVGKIFYLSKNVFGYNQLGIGRLIYQLPLSICQMFVDEVFCYDKLDSLDEETLGTIQTFFANNLNLSETSRQLYVHRNTLVYRFEKLEKKFGLDIRTFEDALTFKIAMMVVDYVKYMDGRDPRK